ncbi:MAG TPA: NfeD family protein [Gammaproteobacteria bacterium]|nr:NfeD family protein [Gammaproteobacteria bacterium]
MLELLNDSVLWWHWIVIGLVLLAAEMMTGTFLLLGLGIAAILVGAVDLLSNISFTTELLLWLVFSVVAMGIWFKWFRVESVSRSGQSNYRLDTLGTVLEEITPHQRGKVAFDVPVLGNTTWHATARTEIPKGARVKIVQVTGQLIEVEQI